MEHHGSESYYVLGEGLLAESEGGRSHTLAAATEAATPPFRFSRMGPNGVNRQLGLPNLRKIGAAMAQGGGPQAGIPSGFTYLGQFVDHDLTFDKTAVSLGTLVAPAELLQARSPSLDLDSLYGAGPTDPQSARFYEADGEHLQIGTTVPAEGVPAKPGLRPAARRRHHRRGEAAGDHPRPAQRREPRRGADARRLHPLPQPRGRHPARLGARRPAVRARRARSSRATTSGCCAPTSCPASARPPRVDDVFTNGRKAFEVGVPATDVPTMPIEFSVAAYRLGHSMVRASYEWNRIFAADLGTLEFLFEFSGQRHARRRAAAAELVDRRLAAALRLHGGRADRSRRAAGEVQPRAAHRHAAGGAAGLPAGGDGGGQPRDPQPRARAHGAAGDRPADGRLPARQGAVDRDADGCTAAHRQRRRRPWRADGDPARRRSSATPRCGSTSCARPSSTRAGG